MEKEQIKLEIEAFKNTNGGDYSDYYIGITNDITRRIDEVLAFIHEHIRAGEYTAGAIGEEWECINRENAIVIEQYFQKLGMYGYNPASRGVEDTKFVYCYKMDHGNKAKYIREDIAKQEGDPNKYFKDFNTFVKTEYKKR